MTGDTDYPFETNLVGAYNCLELARRDGAQFVFLSTSRVYPYPAPEPARARADRDPVRARAGPGDRGRRARPGSPSPSRSTGPARSTGRRSSPPSCSSPSTRRTSALRTVVDRCGVIAGPWQMGRVDQGVFTFWLLHHHFARPLTYIGYGGGGHQVRDLLHVADLFELIDEQLSRARPLGRVRRQRRRRARGEPVAARDDVDLPRADRQRGADRARRRGSARGRSALPLRLLAALRSHGVAPAARPGRDTRRHPRLDRPTNEDAVAASLGFDR